MQGRSCSEYTLGRCRKRSRLISLKTTRVEGRSVDGAQRPFIRILLSRVALLFTSNFAGQPLEDVCERVERERPFFEGEGCSVPEHGVANNSLLSQQATRKRQKTIKRHAQLRGQPPKRVGRKACGLTGVGRFPRYTSDQFSRVVQEESSSHSKRSISRQEETRTRLFLAVRYDKRQ